MASERYRRLKPLGQGGAGRVWLAADTLRSGAPVALKELLDSRLGAEQRLRAEFAILSALHHPNVVRVYEFGVSGEIPHFTLEFIDGVNIVEAIRTSGSGLLLEFAAEALRALAFLHDSGFIHRDLKPSNVLIRKTPRQGCRLVLLDFGLALQGGAVEGKPPAGTLAYLAPEILQGEPASKRSDLFGLGALLFEAVHGRPLVEVDAGIALSGETVTRAAAAEWPLPDGYPAGLQSWLTELLSPDPASRPPTASEALARLNFSCGTRFPAETSGTRAGRLASGAPAGREKELQIVWSLLESPKRPRIIWLSGGAGTGKSRMLRWLAAEAVRIGWRVSAAIDSVPDAPAPAVALLDEIEAAAQGVIAQLGHIAQDESHVGPRIVAAIRREEVRNENLSTLLSLPPSSATHRIDLHPLDATGVRKMVEQATGNSGVAESMVQWLLSTSEGNPLIVESLLVDAAWERGGGTVSHESLENSVARRISHLSAIGHSWLEALVVLGTGTRDADVADVAELEGGSARTAAEEVAAAGLARDNGGQWSTSSRLIDTQVLQALEPERSASLHLRAAQRAASAHEVDTGKLARYWAGAGEAEKSIELAIKAGEIAERRGQAGEAAEWYRFALVRIGRRDSRRRSLRTQQAAMLFASDQVAAAVRAYSALVAMSGENAERADLLGCLAYALLRAGRYPRAGAIAQRGIELAERLQLRAQFANSEKLLGMSLIQQRRLEDSIPHLEAALRAYDVGSRGSSRGEVLFALGSTETRLHRFGAAREHLQEALPIAFESGDQQLHARVLLALGILEHREWHLEDALVSLDRAKRVIEQNKLQHSRIYLTQNLAFLHRDLGRLDRAKALGAEFESLVEHAAHRHDWIIARQFRAEILALSGHPHEAAALLESVLQNESSAETALLNYVKLSLAEALLEVQDSPQEKIDKLLDSVFVVSEGFPNLRLTWFLLEMERRARFSKVDGFSDLWRRREEHLAATGLRLDPPTLVRTLLARARVLLADRDLEGALSSAGDAMRAAEENSLPDLGALACILLAESNRGLAQQQSLERGRQYLEEAAHRIEDPEMRRDFLDRPVFRPLREAPATKALAAGQDRLLALYDMIRVLNSETDPEALLESMLDMALQVVRAERGLILLRTRADGEYSVHLARNLERETIRDAERFSRSVVSQAGAGKAVLAVDTGSDDRLREFKSVSLYGIRSVLCVPLRTRGTIIGAVYVDSRTEGSFFRPEDLKFLEAFADHAALALENARMRRDLEQENRRLQVAAETRVRFDNIIGRSAGMQRVFDLIERVAQTNLPVLIQGESGTGKELVAHAIHFHGSRRKRPFLTENCAAIPETLLESELFGHVRGSFTGAERDRAGLFEQADGGTLFLDEVGDMSPAMQARLLRVLQEGELRRVGGDRTQRVDVRVVAATHRDLAVEVKAGRFREDLMYRLQVLLIALPPLRERVGDIPLLVEHLLQRIGEARGRPAPPVRSAVLELFERYAWPGNIRQLENTLQRLVLLAGDGPVTPAIVESDATLRQALLGEVDRGAALYSLVRTEREQIAQALRVSEGNRARAAQLLGISRATIFRKIKEYGLA